MWSEALRAKKAYKQGNAIIARHEAAVAQARGPR